MRLLKYDDDGRYSLEQFQKDKIPPRYAILSHTWGQGEDDEVTFKDVVNGTGNSKPGFKKVEFCGKQAKHDDLHYFWVDTCCIDKSDFNELATAINSMFRWYENAERCYVYLSDVSVHARDGSEHVDWESSFYNSRWFKRGWTLQELLAPSIVEFYSRDCVKLGDKKSLEQRISEVAGISVHALRGRPLSQFSIEERLRWGERRETTEEEDQAYCLLGIFGVHMPLIHAEGRQNAMRRLLKEVEQYHQYRPHGQSNRYWLVPRRSNTLFTGQRELFAKLEDQLLPSAAHFPKQEESRAFVLYGLGGVGKSEVCIKFAEKHRDCYWGVFWIDASSTTSAERSFGQIATRCGLSRTEINDVCHWLANSENNWLLIIDNADDPDFDYSGYLPAGTRGSILLTSRSPYCEIYGNAGSEEITGLEVKDAVQLLLKSSAIAEDMWSVNMADACRIVEVLDRHALAINQAGAFVKRKFCSLKEYPQRFRQHRQTLLQFFPRQAQSTYQNVYATFEVSARFLAQSGQEKHLRALQLLNILGFMHLNQVSEHIFTRAARHISRVLAADRNGENFAQLYSWHLERAPSATLPKATLGGLDTYAFCEARDTLVSLSLVKVSGDELEISMHPLVHAWIRDRMQDSLTTQRAEWERAAVILALSTEESSSYQNYFPTLHIQITACLDACPSGITTVAPIDTGYPHLFYRFGYTQISQGQISRSIGDALYGYVHRFSISEQNAIHCKKILGSTLIEKDDVLAVAMLEEVLQFQNSILPENDYERLASQHELARALMGVGENDRAVGLLEEVVRIESSTLPEDHRDRLISQQVLARALIEIGENVRAVELLEEVLRIESSMLPENDGERLASQHVLARALIGVGENVRAVELLEEVLRIESSMLPEDDGERLASQHVLARALIEIGENVRAVELLEEVVRIESLTLPEDNRERLTSQHVLARALIGVGENVRAVELLEEVVRIESLTLPEDNRERLTSQHVLARALIEVGENVRAVELLEEVVRIESSMLPEDDGERLASQHVLARALIEVGENVRAVELLEEVVRIKSLTLPEDHRSRLVSQHELSRALIKVGED